jgi:EXS family
MCFFVLVLLTLSLHLFLVWFHSCLLVMDWGMMKNPSVAATAICKFPMNISNGNGVANGPYLSVPTRDSMVGDIRSPVGRNPSNTHITPAASSSAGGPSGAASCGSCWYALLRNRLRFGVWVSVLILFTDIVLRFSWTLRFYHKLFPSGDTFVLCTQFLEVVRRALWNLLRVEWENLKQSGQHHSNGMLGHGTKTTGTKAALQPSSSIQLNVLNNSLDEETTSFLRAGTSHGKLTNIGKKAVGK